MKYKRLEKAELKELEPEFIRFLAAAQITGSDWEKMKSSSPQQAEEMLDVFSDLVYEKVMNKIDYLEYRDQKSLNIFHFTPEKVVLRGLRVKSQSDLDLTAGDVFASWNDETLSMLDLVRSEKNYQENKGKEVFDLIQTGCLITDNKLFDLLNRL